MPSITKAQILAVVQAVIGVAVAFHLSLSRAERDSIIQLCTAALVILPAADAYLRGKRVTAHAVTVSAQAAAAAVSFPPAAATGEPAETAA